MRGQDKALITALYSPKTSRSIASGTDTASGRSFNKEQYNCHTSQHSVSKAEAKEVISTIIQSTESDRFFYSEFLRYWLVAVSHGLVVGALMFFPSNQRHSYKWQINSIVWT